MIVSLPGALQAASSWQPCTAAAAAQNCAQQVVPFLCRQSDPSASAVCASITAATPWQPHQRCRRRAARRQIATARQGGAGQSADLWSEDLTNPSWGEGWEQEDYENSEQEPTEIWPEPEEPAGPEAIAQNVLAIALVTVLALAAGTVLWKLLVVVWALITAAARYSFVAVVLLVIAVFLS